MPRIPLVAGADTSADHSALISKLSELDRALAAVEAGGIPAARVSDFAQAGDSDDTAAVQRSLDYLAGQSGGILDFEGRVYRVSKAGSNPWTLNLAASNVWLRGKPGLTWLQHVAGQPAATNPILLVDSQTSVLFSGIGFDGNWGNAVTLLDDSMAGLPSSSATINVLSTAGFPPTGSFTIAEPTGAGEVITYSSKTATAFVGCSGGSATVLQAGWRVGYVDSQAGINHATQADPKNYGLMIRGCTDVVLDRCRFRNTYGDCIWIGHAASSVTKNSQSVRILGCRGDVSARDGIALGGPVDGLFVGWSEFHNVYAQAFDTESGASQPDRNVFLLNSLFDSWFNPSNHPATSPVSIVTSNTGSPSPASDARQYHLLGCTINGPVTILGADNCTIQGGRIACDFSGTSVAPVYVDGIVNDLLLDGVHIYDRSGDPAPGSAASTHQGAVTLVNSGTQQAGQVRLRGCWIHSKNGRNGVAIHGVAGYVELQDTLIDCSTDGYGNGGHGVYVAPDATGSRVALHNVKVYNATGSAVQCKPPGAPNVWAHLQMRDVTAYDDQGSPTCTSVVEFLSNPTQVTLLEMANCKSGGGVATTLTGITSGRWLVSGGPTEQWEGYGAPAFTAPKGSRYFRVDGGAGTTFYVNEAGNSTWAAK